MRELAVAEGDRLLGAPLQVGEGLPADEVDLGLEGRLAAEGQRDAACARIGRFWVVSVWRPGPKVSSALPSRKNTAHWFSWTMSWAPSLMSAEPLGGSRWTISAAGVVEVLDDLEKRRHLPPT